MTYCRYENTSADFADCVDNWDENELSDSELKGMVRILKSVRSLLGTLGVGYDEDDMDTAIKYLKNCMKP